MKLAGKTTIGTSTIREATVQKNAGIPFSDLLEDCFLSLCRELDIPVPLWMKKNTRELGAFRKTFFTSDQFVEKVGFDRFEIRLEE